jgi:hypothetical protein
MGFARRVVRKSVRRATPRPVRQAMHPARTVRNAVTPRPVKQVSRAAYTVRHPVGAAENKVIGAALYPGTGAGRRGGLSFWLGLWRRREQPEPPAPVPVWPNAPRRAPVTRSAPIAPPQASARQAPVQQPRQRRTEPWPARQAFRTPPPPSVQPPKVSEPSPARHPELDVRRRVGLGDGSRSHTPPKAD